MAFLPMKAFHCHSPFPDPGFLALCGRGPWHVLLPLLCLVNVEALRAKH